MNRNRIFPAEEERKGALDMKRILSVVLALMMLFATMTVFAEETVVEPEEDILLATVNGAEIYNSDLAEYVDYYTYMYNYYGYDTTDASLISYINNLGMNTAIQMKLMYQQAEATGIADAVEAERETIEAAAKAEWEELVSQFETENYGISDVSTEGEKTMARMEALAVLESDYGYTESSYIEEAVESTIMERMQAAMTEGAEVTEEDIQADFAAKVAENKEAYEGNIYMYEFYTMYYGEKSYYVPEGYKSIQSILLGVDEEVLNNYKTLKETYDAQQEAAAAATEEIAEETVEAPAEGEPEAEPVDPVTEEQVETARKAVLENVQPTIDEIMAKFNAGTPFADLIVEYTIDPGMQNEETRNEGYHVHANSVVWEPEFVTMAQTLEKIGDVSEPLVDGYGVQILYYMADVPSGAVEITEEIRNTIYEELLSTKEAELSNSIMLQWMEAAEIVYTEAGQAFMAEAAVEEATVEEATAEETAAEE